MKRTTTYLTRRRFLLVMCCFVVSLAASQSLLGAGGTSVIAHKGQPASVLPGWPEGAEDLVNDPMRTSGWNSWFSQWPNDVNHYAFDAQSTDDVNRLIEKLASVKSDLLQIRLSHLKEPKGLGV